ncbi:hypothetical protein ACLRDC_14345 [Gluconacetobacter sacchari]|uniref:Uncharacterized protein n=2 Tax=Gluconacetobacter sacchari TaxID=92759 RepID=A0A7W4IC72_9PROT|nr:hypothetical protein [Gluconacetobacter sacchari]MBB2160179.1 hypothetical protein [Gluconacetobacter sacchari]GBQ19829.1 hypothetical protein AA12717_0367 [Gluconacetobacter sacchari DSM 12717]
MVHVSTGWPRNYDLDFVGRIEDIKTTVGPEDEGLPYQEQHRYGIKLPRAGIYYFSAAEIRKIEKKSV